MFSWLSQRRHSTPLARRGTRPAQRPRLTLEHLETRNCLTAPTLTSFSAQIMEQDLVLLSGHVSHSNPTACVVSFTGAVESAADEVDVNGYFSMIARAESLGTVQARAMSPQWEYSSPQSDLLACDAPTITLTYSTDEWGLTFNGHVTHEDPEGLPIEFGGAIGGVAYANAVGDFSFTPDVIPDSGTVTAITWDWWNQDSNEAQVTLGEYPNSVSLDAYQDSPNHWVFSGEVTAEYAPGMWVHLYCADINLDQYVQVQSDDTYTYSCTISNWLGKTVSTQLWDGEQFVSEVSTFVLDYLD